MTTLCARMFDRGRAIAVGAALLAMTMTPMLAANASAQAPAAEPAGPNSGALSFTGGLDTASKYLFRGFVQETDSKLTLFPYGDLGISFYSGEGALKSASVNFGVWNALLSGSSGSDGDSGKLHYELDWYSTLTLGFGGGFTVGTTWTAYTSPNNSFSTAHDVAFKVSHAHMLAPYGLIAFELDGQADGGSSEGVYLELGVGPSWSFADGKVSVAVPLKVGMSLSDYYEGPDGDSGFGYFQVGGLVTVPFTKATSKFGAWNIHGGIDIYALGDTTKAFNNGDSGKVVASFGIGVVY